MSATDSRGKVCPAYPVGRSRSVLVGGPLEPACPDVGADGRVGGAQLDDAGRVHHVGLTRLCSLVLSSTRLGATRKPLPTRPSSLRSVSLSSILLHCAAPSNAARYAPTVKPALSWHAPVVYAPCHFGTACDSMEALAARGTVEEKEKGAAERRKQVAPPLPKTDA
eukprot:3092568-Rhodomonas_salina.1